MKKKKRAGINCLVPFLFAVYMVLLVWIILFKLQLSIHDLDTVITVVAAIVTAVVVGGVSVLLISN